MAKLSREQYPPPLLPYKFINKLQGFSFIHKIYLFGSRARGDFKPHSDIDIAILCPQANISDWLDILAVIDHADTLLKIDCVRLDTTDPLLKEKILQEGIVIYERPKNSTEMC